jgi:hypothetical protein
MSIYGLVTVDWCSTKMCFFYTVSIEAVLYDCYESACMMSLVWWVKMYSTCNYTRYWNRLLLCWCIYCLAEWFCCVPPAPYGHNTAAFGPLFSSGRTTGATRIWFMPEDLLHHNICVPCSVIWNWRCPLNVEISCNDISFKFNYIMVVMYETSPEPVCTVKFT